MRQSLDAVRAVGLDGHRKFSIAVGRDASGKIVDRRRLEHGDRAELRRRLGEYPPGTEVVLEASFGWGWLSDEVARAGLVPKLASAKKVSGWREGRGMAKSNRKDAELLSELPLEREPWWEVWLPPAEVRSRREWFRHRTGLVRMQTTLKNRIHATLHRHGILMEMSDLFGVKGRRALSLLVGDEHDDRISDSGRRTLKELLILLDQVRRSIARATRMLGKETEAHPAMTRLLTLPGVGRILAQTIIAEIGKIERFARSRKLCRYACLTPMSQDSGEPDDSASVGRHVGHDGRLTLKWAFIEAAHGAVRSDAMMKAIFQRRTDDGKRDRSIGHIAVAHRLCELAYVLWKKDTDYNPAGVARPGSRTGPEPSRGVETSGNCRAVPSADQPEHPMTAAAATRRQV